MGVCCASTRRAQRNNESRSRQITRNRFFKRGGGYFSLLNSISSPKSSGFLFSWNRCSSKSIKQYDRQSSGTSSALSAITWGASTRSRQSSRSKEISPEARPLSPSRPGPPYHSDAHPDRSHPRTCRKSRTWTVRF